MSCCLRTSPKPASWRRGKICVYRPKRCRILRLSEAPEGRKESIRSKCIVFLRIETAFSEASEAIAAAAG